METLTPIEKSKSESRKIYTHLDRYHKKNDVAKDKTT